MTCSQCGYYCPCLVWHTKQCLDEHVLYHARTMEEQDQYYNSKSSSSQQSIFVSKQKRCPSCEEPINNTEHVCKGKEKSVDIIDFLIDLFKDKK